MCYESGTIIDDFLVYKLDDDHFLIVVNASNIEKDFKWMEKNKKGDVQLKNVSDELGMIAFQGPNSEKVLQKMTDYDLSTLKYFWMGDVKLEDLTIFEQITRPLSSYEQIGPHVKAAQKSRAKGRPVGEGSVIGFVIVKGSGSISDRAMPVEDVKEGEYDPDYYINNQVLPAAMRVLQALEITEQQVLSGRIQAKLGKWFEK
jgi:DNA polymerase elongation subunit (family B)